MVRHHRFFFALFSLFRFSVSLGLIERPLVVGLLWGLATDSLETSLYISVFYELLWLDFIPVGTFIPPHMTAATFTALALSEHFGLNSLPLVVVPLIAGLPMAWIGARIERIMRDRLNRSYSGVLHWVRKPLDLNLPGRLMAGTLASKILANWAYFVAGMFVLLPLTRFVLTQYGTHLAGLRIQWSELLIAASLGGMLALRLRNLYLSLAGGAAVFGILRFAGMF